MDDDIGKIKIYPDHFEASPPTGDLLQKQNSPVSQTRTGCTLSSHSRFRARKKLMVAATMLRLFSGHGRPWGSANGDQGKVELTAPEIESLRSEIADLEEREALLKARLEHLDEVLMFARLTGYLYIRTRWLALPGELPIDDSDVDDWLPRFVVLHGLCIYFYLSSTDLSPQDSTLLSDVVEVSPLPSFIQEDGQTRHSFHVLTRQGLRFECWSLSEIQSQMASKPLTTEAIALTEKKMDMTLEDIIQMSKKPTTITTTTTKVNNRRALNKSQKPFNTIAAQGNSLKVRRFMDSRSSLRQGALAQRRSSFLGNQFPIATEAARRAAIAPIRNRPFNHNRLTNWNRPRVGIPPVQRRGADIGFAVVKRQNQQTRMVPKQRPQTLDSLFANMKEQRMRVQQKMTRPHMSANGGQQYRGRGRYGNYAN